MTAENFIFWLRGWMEIQKPETITKEQLEEIRNHLALVKKEQEIKIEPRPRKEPFYAPPLIPQDIEPKPYIPPYGPPYEITCSNVENHILSNKIKLC